MKCPFCHYRESSVVDSRPTSANAGIRRRRQCLKCSKRFTTYEYNEELPMMVVKKDGRRQAFDRKKILNGIVKACEKRQVSVKKMEQIVAGIERHIHKKFDREVGSTYIGEKVMEHLAALDDVAYVRFASVYRQFKDVNQFMKELKDMFNKGKKKARR
ncbi:MAG: transcriptional regulator NrdR [Candidatus Omnitrophica bacterium]|nr:transcriptional regulator NrdR [Candidatus Omnitrophota bacterium]